MANNTCLKKGMLELTRLGVDKIKGHSHQSCQSNILLSLAC